VANITVIYDASVLYPAPLRDFLMWLALTDLFKARWTEEIHQEWIRNVLKNRPDLTLAQLDRTKNLMNTNVRDALVIGYKSLIPKLELPDLNDRHVLAAAIQSRADFIVTFNLKDFPTSVLAKYGVEAIHPDEFILDLIDIDSTKVCQSAQQQRKTLKSPHLTLEQYLDTLIHQGLPQSATVLRNLLAN
jgi:predicted nucleic acid-binding protein